MIYIFWLIVICTIIFPFKLLKRVIGLLLYPLAYLFRYKVRKYKDKSKLFYFLWLWLDDSIYYENITEYNVDAEYCWYGKRNKLIEKLPEGKFKEFMRSYYWGAVRNNAVNLAHELSIGKLMRIIDEHDSSWYYFRLAQYEKLSLWFPYMAIWIGDIRIKVGWLSSGKFEGIEIRKKPKK